MMDPYKVLNISPNASDDEVKHAYRELARKYHPDNYHDNPLADLAQEKMKEINEAYDLIQKQRKNGGYSGGYTGGYTAGYTSAGNSGYGYGTNYTDLQRVRSAINRGDITQAERMLNEMQEHDAEWNFLMGIVYSRRGWMDDARRFLQTACRMEPANEEYRDALNAVSGQTYYQPQGYRHYGTMTYGDEACSRLCAACSCYMLTCGRCCFI